MTQKFAMARTARFRLGDVVKHRVYPFRGVVFDVDPIFANTDEWWLSIPGQLRPSKDQPFYHLLAVGPEGPYVAYVSEQNLLPDSESGPVTHPELSRFFNSSFDGRYALLASAAAFN